MHYSCTRMATVGFQGLIDTSQIQRLARLATHHDYKVGQLLGQAMVRLVIGRSETASMGRALVR